MTTEDTRPKEEIIKSNLDVIKDHTPKIIEEAEERKFKDLVKACKELNKYVEKIKDDYNKSEKYIEDMNAACNIMFNFMRDNKVGKKLKSTIIETILATYHINQVFGLISASRLCPCSFT